MADKPCARANKPCAISWCVALAAKDHDLCPSHLKQPGFKPTKKRPVQFVSRARTWPPTPWDDEIDWRNRVSRT